MRKKLLEIKLTARKDFCQIEHSIVLGIIGR